MHEAASGVQLHARRSADAPANGQLFWSLSAFCTGDAPLLIPNLVVLPIAPEEGILVCKLVDI